MGSARKIHDSKQQRGRCFLSHENRLGVTGGMEKSCSNMSIVTWGEK